MITTRNRLIRHIFIILTVLLFAGACSDEASKTTRGIFSVKGEVSGLSGGSLTVKLNDLESQEISQNGEFTFENRLFEGEDLTVIIVSNPSSPSQVCTINKGQRENVKSDVVDIRIFCSTQAYNLGGRVEGLQGSGGLDIRNINNTIEHIEENGEFTFNVPIADHSGYLIDVVTQPDAPEQQCDVQNGSGTVDGADVTDVLIKCMPKPYNVGVRVTGLQGTGLVLQLDSEEQYAIQTTLPIPRNGEAYVFEQGIPNKTSFTISQHTAPTDPNQNCSAQLEPGDNVVFNADKLEIAVVCESVRYNVSGQVSGLIGTGLKLRLNNNDTALDVSPEAGTEPVAFTFPAEQNVADGQSYSVEVAQMPTGPSQQCGVTQTTDTINGQDVTDVQINCASGPPPQPVLSFGEQTQQSVKAVHLQWDAVADATSYKIMLDENGDNQYDEVATIAADAETSTYDYYHEVSVHTFNWWQAKFQIQACHAVGETPMCASSNEVVTYSDSGQSQVMLDAIGYFKGNPSEYDNEFGASVALSSDGRTMAVSADGAGETGVVYIFDYNGNEWVQSTILKHPAPAFNERNDAKFGVVMDISDDGNILVVGASEDDSNAMGIHVFDPQNPSQYMQAFEHVLDDFGYPDTSYDAGAAFIFERIDGDWVSKPIYLKPPETYKGAGFGESVAISGNGKLIGVGARQESTSLSWADIVDPQNRPQDNRSVSSAGAAYLFVKNTGGNWEVSEDLRYPLGTNGDAVRRQFGHGIAINQGGTKMVVTASAQNAPASGEVFILTRDAPDSSWYNRDPIRYDISSCVANLPENHDLGTVVDMDSGGNTVVVGDYDNEIIVVISDIENEGCQLLNGEVGSQFGSAVAVSGDGAKLVVGAYHDNYKINGVFQDGLISGDTPTGNFLGGAFYYEFINGNWQKIKNIKPSNTDSFGSGFLPEEFGDAVAINEDGTTIAIPAVFESGSSVGINGDRSSVDGSLSGAVYLY